MRKNIKSIAYVKNLGSMSFEDVSFFNDNFDCNFEEQSDSYGNVFLKIPTLYRRIDKIQQNQITDFSISFYPHPGFTPYPVFEDEDGDILDFVYIGKKIINRGISMEQSKEKIQSLGPNYQMIDWQFQKVLVDLFLIMSKKVSFKEGAEKLESFLGFDDLHLSFFVDGVVYNNGHWLFALNPSEYVFHPTSSTRAYRVAKYPAPNGNYRTIKKLGYDSSYPFFNYPCEGDPFTNYTYYANEYLWINYSDHCGTMIKSKLKQVQK